LEFALGSQSKSKRAKNNGLKGKKTKAKDKDRRGTTRTGRRSRQSSKQIFTKWGGQGINRETPESKKGKTRHGACGEG